MTRTTYSTIAIQLNLPSIGAIAFGAAKLIVTAEQQHGCEEILF
ncbi:hypothetical protein [Moorena sp. SIO4G3]|nr:hypothetical protein [Moorena sp. SIO4G3]